MQSKTTFNKMRKVFKTTALALGFLSLLTGLANAQTYVNGNLSTGANLSGGGAAAPAGTTWSEVQLGNTTAGFNAAITTAAFRIADDFVVPAGPSWNVTSMRFYGYQTGYAGATSPFTTIRITIHSGTVTGPVVFGDQTTNRFAGTGFANMYRVFNATNDLTRRIWYIDANVNVTLAPGTYWIEYATDVTGGANHFLPNSTVAGQVTQAGNNAQSLTIASNTWAPAVDGANPQDMPFSVNYNTGACSGTPAPGNTVASATSTCAGLPISFSLQNATSGSGVTYQWQTGPSATGPWTPVAGATNSTYSTSPTATAFYSAVVTCGAASTTSTPVQVTVTQCYCTAGATSTAFEKISRVQFGSINNPSTSTAGYENFTNLSTPAYINSTMPITVTLAGGFAADQVKVWIDFNRDFDFDDAGEAVYTSANGVGPHTGNIVIPAGLTSGPTRMRVRMHDTSLGANGTPCGTSTYGQVEDYTVNLVPCIPATVTTQPANASVACGGNTSFTVALAGSDSANYWQYKTSAASTNWIDVPNSAPYAGITTNTLVITGATAAMNGYQYRAVYRGACTGASFSNAATLTVTALVPVVNPAAPSVCNGGVQQLSLTNSVSAANTATFNATGLPVAIPDNTFPITTATAIPITVSGIPAGSVIQNIGVRFTIPHTYAGDVVMNLNAPNGQNLNLFALLDGGQGTNATANFTNTTIDSTSTTNISGAPAPRPGIYRAEKFAITNPNFGDMMVTNVGWNALLSTINGTWTIKVADLGLGDVGTVTSLSLFITYTAPGLAQGTWAGPAGTIFTDAGATIPYTGTPATSVYVKPLVNGVNNYTVSYATALCQSATTTVPVTVRQLATSATAVANQAICVGGSTTLTSTVAGGSGNSLQWEYSTNNGATYTNVPANATYSGTTTSTLTITNATATMNGYLYRLVASAAPCAGSVTSGAGTLTVNALPVLNLTASPFTAIYPGQTTTLAVASTTTVPANGYVWTRNGVVVPNATGNTLVVDVDGIGQYSVSVADANGCGNAVPATITITSAPNDIMFVYPSPNTGMFQVRYYSAAGNNPLPRVLNIYDSKGARVYSRTYTVAVPYSRMDVDMSGFQKGIYQVELADRNGNRLKTGRVVIL